MTFLSPFAFLLFAVSLPLVALYFLGMAVLVFRRGLRRYEGAAN